MTTTSDARFWDRAARKYARSKIGDPGGYDRTLDRTRTLLAPDDRVLELGCGTGTTALRLAQDVNSYLATDLSPEMIAIAEEKYAAAPIPGLSFAAHTAQSLASHPSSNLSSQATQFDTVLGFNYLHLVEDLPDTLRCIRALLAPQGLFISKTPCLGDMNLLIRSVLLPAMRAIGKAPHVAVFGAGELSNQIEAAGFDILATESHATKGRDARPFIVARRRGN